MVLCSLSTYLVSSAAALLEESNFVCLLSPIKIYNTLFQLLVLFSTSLCSQFFSPSLFLFLKI